MKQFPLASGCFLLSIEDVNFRSTQLEMEEIEWSTENVKNFEPKKK